METLNKVFHHQIKHNGLVYTLSIQTTQDFPSKDIQFSEHIRKQFNDITDNHSQAELEKIDKELVRKLAADQLKEAREEKRAFSRFRKAM